MSPRLVKITAACALAAALAGVAVGLGAGADQREVAAPAYAIEQPNPVGHAFLVRVDPQTLRPVGIARIDLGRYPSPPARSPDGTGAAFSVWPYAQLRLVDLTRLRPTGSLALAGSGAFVKAQAWLTADRLVALMQRNRGPYKSIVGSREAVLVDPLARKVLDRSPVGDVRALLASAQSGDKLVLLFGPAKLQKHGPLWLAVIGADRRFQETAVPIGRTAGLSGFAVDQSGSHAYLLAAGNPLFEVDLDTLQVSRHEIAGAPSITGIHGYAAFRQLAWIDEHTLAASGMNGVAAAGREATTGAGLALIDTASWQARMIDSKAASFDYGASTLLAFQWNERSTYRTRPGESTSQTITGGGMTAYSLDGKRLYHRYGRERLYAYAFRDVAVVSKPFGPGNPLGVNRPKSDVLELASGQVIGRVPYNLQPLADPPNVRLAARTSQSASGNEEPLTVDGDGSSLTGHAADGVASVVALLLDGTQQPLPLDDSGDFGYQAATPDQTARTVEALAADGSLLASVDLVPTAAQPAAPTTTAPAPQPNPNPPQTAAPGQFAIFSGVSGSTLAQVDPRTLRPLKGRVLLLGLPYPVFARSPDGRQLAVSDRDGYVRFVDLDSLTSKSSVRFEGERTVVRSLAWVAPRRLLAVVQRMSAPYNRRVVSRTLYVVDPATARIVGAKTVTNKLAFGEVGVAGGRLVGLLSSSDLKGSTVELLVADGQRMGTPTVEVGRFHGVLRRPAVALAPSGRHAYLFFSVLSGGRMEVLDLDLDRLRTSVHPLRLASGTRLPPAAVASISPSPAVAVGETQVAVSGVVPLSGPSGLHPAAGVFLVDTRTFTVRLVDPAATYFQVADGKLFTYGRRNDANVPRPGGVGISAYDANGTLLYHLYGNRTFGAPLLFADGYGHVLLQRPKPQLVFDANQGHGLGTTPAPPTPDIQLVPGPTVVTASATTPMRSARTGPPTITRVNPFAQLSNRGRLETVTAAQRTTLRRIGMANLRTVFLLAERAGRAFYVLGRDRLGRFCWAVGRAGSSDLGSVGCSAGFPTRAHPFLDSSIFELQAGDRSSRLVRMEGFAADAIASMRLVDSSGHVPATIPVEGNVYVYAPRNPVPVGELQALDAGGNVIERERFGKLRAPKVGSPRLARFGFSIAVPSGWYARPYESRDNPAAGPALIAATFPLEPFTLGSEYTIAQRMPVGGVFVVVSEAGAGSKRMFPPVRLPIAIHRSDLRPRGGFRLTGANALRNLSVHGRLIQVMVQFRRQTVSDAALARVNSLLATLRISPSPLPPRGAKPIQHAEADGFAVDVYRSGLIVFHALTTNSPAYKLLAGTDTSPACFRFRRSTGSEVDEWGVARPFADQLSFSLNTGPAPRAPLPAAPRPPYDGCQLSGSYGNRWNDGHDRHAPVEIPFNERARRFFAERAAARDLALFVRSPQMTAIRKAMKRGGKAPSSWAIARRYPSRVITLQHASDVVPGGNVGVWSNGRDLIVASERAPDGRRLFVGLPGGRIGRHNLHGLAFVF